MHADAVLGDSVCWGHMQMQQSGVRRGNLQLGRSFSRPLFYLVPIIMT